MVVIMLVLAGPDCNRRAHASCELANVPRAARNLARRLVAELVTVAAAVQLDDVEPLFLALKATGMPLPSRPVPGNRLLSGMSSMANQ